MPSPIGPDELSRVARSHGIHLRRDRRCVAPGVVAQASNILPYETAPEQYEKISIEQGEITCRLRAQPQRSANEVVEEKATVSTQFRYLNVACTVSPLPDTNARHVNRLRAVFSDLRRAHSR